MRPWSGTLVAISPYTLPLPEPSEFGRRTWVIPVRGATPWIPSTPGAILEPLETSNSSSESISSPSAPLALLPVPANESENHPLLWTHDSLQAFWSFLCSLREKLSMGPLGLSFNMAKASHGRPFLRVHYIEFDVDGLCTPSVYTENESRPASLDAIDYIKIYHNASVTMLLRNVLDSWSFETIPAKSETGIASSSCDPGAGGKEDKEDASTRTREEVLEASNTGSMRSPGAEMMDRMDSTDSSQPVGMDVPEESISKQQKRRMPKLRPLKGSRLVLLDEQSNGILVA
jgi:hypothetical protein